MQANGAGGVVGVDNAKLQGTSGEAESVAKRLPVIEGGDEVADGSFTGGDLRCTARLGLQPGVVSDLLGLGTNGLSGANLEVEGSEVHELDVSRVRGQEATKALVEREDELPCGHARFGAQALR